MQEHAIKAKKPARVQHQAHLLADEVKEALLSQVGHFVLMSPQGNKSQGNICMECVSYVE